MSFEFSNRIQELTLKLTNIKQNRPRQDRLEQAKEQLYTLQLQCSKQLQSMEKKMKKIEGRFKKRAKRVNSQSSSVQDIWFAKQQRVSQVIGSWVNDYEERVSQAVQDLHRQQLIFKNKIEEEEEMYEKEAKIMEDRINNQIKILDKEIHKWNNINSQNHSAALKQLSSYKQALIGDLRSAEQIKSKELRNVEQRMTKIKRKSSDKITELKDQIDKYTLRTSQILKLLINID